MMKEKIRALIVDDEPPARRDVRSLLRADPEIEVVGECANGREAIEAIESHSPHLVFLDVEMPQITGFDVLEAIDREKMPLVIFVTGHDEYARRAFDVHAVDYLSKPYSVSRFEQALVKAKNTLRTESRDLISSRINAFLEENRAQYPERWLVRENECLLLIKTADIDWVDVDNHMVRFHVGGKFYDRRQSLSSLEAQLDPKQFWRIERSYIVNVERIRQINILSENKYEIVLHGGKTLAMSRDYRKRLRDLGWDL